MEISHHFALLIGYATALIGWLIAARVLPTLWIKREAIDFQHPWQEVAWALAAIVAVLAIGQLYMHDWLLPAQGLFESLINAANQILIFSPLLLLIIFRKHSLSTAWLPKDRIWVRLLIGLGLALTAILTFTLARTGSDSWLQVVP